MGVGEDVAINDVAVEKEIQNVLPTAIEESLAQIDQQKTPWVSL